MQLIVMAAGMGSRYGGIKQIDPVGPHGEIILDYSVWDAAEAGFDRVVFVIRRDIEQSFRDTIGNRFSKRMKVDYAFQDLEDLPGGFTAPEGRRKPWGTGQALLSCAKLVDAPFLAINADDFYGADAYRIGAKGLKSMDSSSLDAFLVGYRLDNTLSPHGYVTRGICETRDDRLIRIVERLKIGRNEAGVVEYQDENGSHSLQGEEVASMNFWGFTASLFPVLEELFTAFLEREGEKLDSEFLIPSVVDSLIKSGKIKNSKVLNTDASWFGITFPEDKSAVKKALAALTENGDYPSPLWPSV